MIKIIKKLSIAMLTASILFATIGTSAHAASKDNKKIQYYKEYQSIIKKVNTSKNKHLQLKDFSAISEKNLLTPTKFEKVVKGDEVADYDDISYHCYVFLNKHHTFQYIQFLPRRAIFCKNKIIFC